MGSGYRNDRARDQARAVKEQFLAPGVPVEVARPPAPPPPVVGAAAAGAGAGAAATGVLATIGSVGIGLGLGAWVRADIERFKKTAVQPFYDDVAWKKSSEEVLDDWWKYEIDLPEWDAKPPPVFYRMGTGVSSWFPSDAYAPDGFHGPVISNGSSYVYWHYDGQACGGSRDRWRTVGWFPDPCAGGTQNFAFPSCNNALGTTGDTLARWVCPSDPTIWATFVGAGDITTVANRWRTVERYSLASMGLPAGHPVKPVGEVILEPGFGTPAAPLAMPADDFWYDTRPRWKDGVAPPGTQPSMAQQLADERLASGKTTTGHVVPFSLGHPFTIVRVSPGAGSPVTVPDQVIDPGSETDPGGVTIVPPGHPPNYPKPDETKEKKPSSQRVIAGGFMAINVVTEAQDFLEAMHAALPKHLRSTAKGDVPPWVILQDIWDHWDEFDADLALENFVNNQIEDAIYGRYFALQSRASRMFTGLGTDRRFGQTIGLARATRGPRPGMLPQGAIPEVHFANGQHSIDWAGVEIDQSDGSIDIEGGYF